MFVHFFVVVLHDYGVKLSCTFYTGIVVCVPVRFFFVFLLLLSFTSVAASISHFLTSVTKIFIFSFQQNTSPLFLSLDLTLSLLSMSVKKLTFSRKKDSA